MQTRIKLALGVLVLAAGALSLHALQTGAGGAPAEGNRCACTAGGTECLFGSAEGCQITCTNALCDCRGASCTLGFPRPARCRCRTPAA